MAVIRSSLEVETRGNCDVIDITSQLAALVRDAAITNGAVIIFCPSSTSALTTMEYETGCIEDLKQFSKRSCQRMRTTDIIFDGGMAMVTAICGLRFREHH